MHTDIISFSTDLVSKVVRCVEDAVGDDIQADIQRNDLFYGPQIHEDDRG